MGFLAVNFAGVDATHVVLCMFAWFAQMGFHEGGHAWAAWWLGDDTAYLLGKRTVNPIRHVNWNDPMSVFNSVGLPLITSIALGFPMGMAWVPVGVHNFRHPARDHAIVAFAGPAGGFVVALICLVLHLSFFPFFAGSEVKILAVLERLFLLTYVTAIIYSVFNLVPIPPLDGSRILYFFGNWRLRELLSRIEPFGFMIIVLLFWILPGSMLLNPFITALMKPYLVLPAMIWGGS